MRPLYILLAGMFVGLRADIVTHFSQATEIGVEQLKANADSDKITFFAAVRAESASRQYQYVLSFGEPICEESCLQSVNAFCAAEKPRETQDWESFWLEHYPSNADPGAVYIRRTLSVSDDSALGCNATPDVLRTVDDSTGIITYSGKLVLSLWEAGDRCEDGCPVFKHSDTYHFNVNYMPASAEKELSFTGLDYELAKYEYSAEATRNIRISDIGLLLEITTLLEEKNTEDEQGSSSAAPVSFQDMQIFKQHCEPEMELVALTECEEQTGTACTQRLYLRPVDQADTAYSKAKGTLEIHASFDSDEGGSYSLAVLHIDVNIDSSDYGVAQREVDLVVATNETEPSTQQTTQQLTPYIINGQSTKNLVDEQQLCIALASPALTPLTLHAVTLCASSSVDLGRQRGCRTEGVEDMKTMALYSIDDSSSEYGSVVQPEGKGNELTYCFNVRKIENFSHVIDVAYTTAITGSENDDSASGVVHLEARSMYDDVASTEGFWIDCPYGYYWDPVCACCAHTHGHSLSTWEWVFLVILGLVVLGVIAFVMFGGGSSCFYGHHGDAWVKPCYQRVFIPNPHHPGYFMPAYRDVHSGKTITKIHIDGDGNEVIVADRTPVRRRRHHQRA